MEGCLVLVGDMVRTSEEVFVDLLAVRLWYEPEDDEHGDSS